MVAKVRIGGRRARWGRLLWMSAVLLAAGLAVAHLALTRQPRAHPAAPPRRELVWQVRRLGALSQPLEGAAAAVLDGRVLLAGGLTAADVSSAELTFFALRPWRSVAAYRLHRAVHDAAMAVVGGRAYLLGGGDAMGPVALVWAISPDGTVRGATALPVPLSDLAAVASGGRIYVFGGFTGRSYSRAVWDWRPGGTWRRVGTLPYGLRYSAAAVLDSRVYLFGGLTSAGPTADILSFDLATGRVRRVGALPRPLMYAGAASSGGQLLVAGGEGLHGFRTAIRRFQPRTGKLTTVGRLPLPLGYFAVAGTALLGGRTDAGPVAQIYQMMPVGQGAPQGKTKAGR